MSDGAGPLPGGDVADRVERQLAFILELDKVKSILRRNTLADASRHEDDAQHMWHLAVMALVLAEHANEPVDVAKVMSMLVLHDVVEIDAGDVFVYDEAAREGQAERERAAADRIYALLPGDQGAALRSLWEEFEAGVTAEARFAAALDRLHPLLMNVASGGVAWKDGGITADRVYARNSFIADIAPSLWEAAKTRLESAVAAGDLAPAPQA